MSLPDTAIAKEIIEFDSIDSTNLYALAAKRSGLVVVAKEQTAGRGRRGRSWFSPKGQNLYMTITVAQVDAKYPIITGVAVHETIADLETFAQSPLTPPSPPGGEDKGEGAVDKKTIVQRSHLVEKNDVKIKWPNDILIRGKKVCGILCETKDCVTAIGIGVNINQDFFSDDISSKATSLKLASGNSFNIEDIRNKILISLDKWISLYTSSGFGPVRDAFLKSSNIIGSKAHTEAGKECLILDLSMDGHLIIEVEGKKQEHLSGDIIIDYETA
jgi:BirA family biotin operon repressor/biotin-[acetyl-CoA-carboxylase] ligase